MIHQFVGHVSTKLDSDPILAKDALEPHVWEMARSFCKGIGFMRLVRVKRWQREFATCCESNAPACPAGASRHE